MTKRKQRRLKRKKKWKLQILTRKKTKEAKDERWHENKLQESIIENSLATNQSWLWIHRSFLIFSPMHIANEKKKQRTANKKEEVTENSQGDRRRHTVVPGEPVTNQLFIHLLLSCGLYVMSHPVIIAYQCLSEMKRNINKKSSVHKEPRDEKEANKFSCCDKISKDISYAINRFIASLSTLQELHQHF